MSSQAQGNIGMGRAIAYFTSKGNTVSLPLNDCQDYDLVVDIDGALSKVQVKTTRYKAPSGNYIVSLVSSGGSKGEIYHRVVDSSCDLLFVSSEDGEDYIFPVENLPRKCLTLIPEMSISHQTMHP